MSTTTYTLTELIASKTQAEVAAEIKQSMSDDGGLPISLMGSSHVPVVTAEATARAMENLYLAISVAATAGLLELVGKEDLTLWAWNFYQLERIGTEFTQGKIKLEDSADTGPYTITPGQLWIKAPNGLLYSNTDGGTLVLGGILTLTFKAKEAGAKYNAVDINTSGWSFTASPLSGVSITNPPVDDTNDWITVQGRDEESDDSLKSRCRTRWPTIGFGTTADAWQYYAKKANSSVTRTKIITNPDGRPGVTRVVIAGVDGALSDDIVADVQEQLNPIATNCTSVEVISAVNREINLTGTVRVLTDSYVSIVEDQLSQTVDTVQGAIGIGGKVYMSPITCAIQDIQKDLKAVVSVELSSMATIELAATEAAKITTTGMTVQVI